MQKGGLDKKRGGRKRKAKEKLLKESGADALEARGDGPKESGAESPEKTGKKAATAVGREKPRMGAQKVLRKAVKAAVKRKCTDIAGSLVRHVADGNIRCAELMLSLMEKKKEGVDGVDGPSIADLLASEPEWDEETEAKRKAGKKDQGSRSKE